MPRIGAHQAALDRRILCALCYLVATNKSHRDHKEHRVSLSFWALWRQCRPGLPFPFYAFIRVHARLESFALDYVWIWMATPDRLRQSSAFALARSLFRFCPGEVESRVMTKGTSGKAIELRGVATLPIHEPNPSPIPRGELETGATNEAPLQGGAGCGFVGRRHGSRTKRAFHEPGNNRRPYGVRRQAQRDSALFSRPQAAAHAKAPSPLRSAGALHRVGGGFKGREQRVLGQGAKWRKRRAVQEFNVRIHPETSLPDPPLPLQGGEGELRARTSLSFRKSPGRLWLAILLGFRASAALAFNLDGQTDIVWQNRATGQTTVWFMNLLAFADNGWVTNDLGAGWQAVATADFNRDGHMDLLWRSPATGENQIWLLRGTNRLARHSLSVGATNFYVVGTGDFNADGYADILWRDQDQDFTAVWFLNGTNWTGQVGRIEKNGDPAWRAVATGDCNNDGYADIYWRHSTTGKNAIWVMRGTKVERIDEIRPEPDLGFQLAATGQFNPLGHTDLLWRHTNGQNALWLMRGTNYLSTVALPAETNRNWTIVGVGGYTNGMMLTAAADAASRRITLAWQYGQADLPAIRRRVLGETSWTTQAVNYAPFRFTNSNLELGKRYEFDVGGQYLLAGLNAAPVEQRGKILLIVEHAAAKALARELETFQADLAGDGWSVIWTNVPRHDDRVWRANTNAIASIKSFVTNCYAADPAALKSILLVGHVPIPYSGFHNPDGHGGRTLPADGYYGDVDGIFTDARVNYTSGVSGVPESRHDNLVGDGKFDQYRYPPNSNGEARLELAVGRIDFAKLPAFKSQSEIDLLRRYLDKNHRYRHKRLVLPERITAGTFFPTALNWEAYAQAAKLGSRMFGSTPQSVVDGDPFLQGHSSVWGILCGYGLPYGIRGQPSAYHETAHMADPAKAPRLLFASLFASYCVDFDYADNFMRAFLGAPDAGLVVTWFRPVSVENVPLAFETLGLGETVGSGFLRMINDNPARSAHMTYLALLGDPTLRLQILAPPSAVVARGNKKVDLSWTTSPEPGAQYFVYRSTNQREGPWKKLTTAPLAVARFADEAAPDGPKLYQVRALKLIETGSGTYTNLSQGAFSRSGGE